MGPVYIESENSRTDSLPLSPELTGDKKTWYSSDSWMSIVGVINKALFALKNDVSKMT